MAKKDNESMVDPKRQTTSSSYLVRVWQETGRDAEVRFYLRDLKTGEERYLGDPKRIGELLATGLRAGRSGQARQRDTA